MSGARRRPGRLGPFVEGYRVWLLEVGYTPQTVRMMLKDLGRLGRWMDGEGVEVGALTVIAIESFLASWRAAGGRRVPTVRALRSLLSYLREVGVMGADEPSALSPVEALAGEEWLTADRGLDSARFYRRWAFESAALDLALRQSGISLQDAVGRPARPVNFVASIRIGDPPSLGPLRALLGVDSELRFKLDPTPSWDDDLVGELARLGCVDVVDMKGWYRNVNVAMDPEADLYRRVIGGLPDVWIEDPALEGSTADLLERHRDRITWDEPIHSAADIEALPWRPRMLNLKPARFGSVRALLDTYDYCAAHGIGAYGGGMFEQGPGRGQLQYLASLFHPDAPNDVAPAGYNLQSSSRDLPRSPLAPEPHPTGFRWGTYDGRRTIREQVTGGPV